MRGWRKSKVECVLAVSLAVAWLGVGSAPVAAEVKPASPFTDGMVLQRGAPIIVWGTADAKEKVTVEIGDRRGEAVADGNGRWKVTLDAIANAGPVEAAIAGKNTIEYADVLMGDVWVCSGQSNMQWTVAGSANPKEEIAGAKYPKIRLFTVPRVVAGKPQSSVKGAWTACTPETVKDFSAVAYFFGRAVHKALDVPVGLIHTSWGGTPAESWASRPTLESDPTFKPILDRWDQSIDDFPQKLSEMEQKYIAWKDDADYAEAMGRPVPAAPDTRVPRDPRTHPHRAAGLYNAMIHPLVPFGIKGAIWYQGESNAGRAYQYRALFPAMIQDWRRAWGQGDFPFLFVQLANFMARKKAPADSAWAELREAQFRTLAWPNTGMAVIIDIGEAKDIHPKNKQDVGYRLALAAQAIGHDRDLVYSGPIYRSMKVEENKIRLTFDHVGEGVAVRGEGKLVGFAIAGKDKKFVWADAEIAGKNAIVVSSAKVAEPVAVRYAWADNPACNLVNNADLPASPFRTDDWPGVTKDAQ